MLGVKAGLDPMTIYEVVKASSGGSKALERIPRALVPRDFEPGFKVALMNKDLETFTHHRQGAARAGDLLERGPALPAGRAGRRARGQDTSVVFTIIERLAGMKAPAPREPR